MKIRTRDVCRNTIEAILLRAGYEKLGDGYILPESGNYYPRYHIRIEGKENFLSLDVHRDFGRHESYPFVNLTDEMNRLGKIFEQEGIYNKVIGHSTRRVKKSKRMSIPPQIRDLFEY